MDKLVYPTLDIQGLTHTNQGKVRDTYLIDEHPHLLLTVASDRVSTHNIVHNSTVPGKGEILTALTVFWMEEVLPPLNIKTHLFAHGKDIFNYIPESADYPDDLENRALVIKRLDMLPYEFIYRKYMAGSLWSTFYSKGIPDPYGLKLEEGMYLMYHFTETIFTPTDKSDIDDPVRSADIIEVCNEAYLLSLKVYEAIRAYALTCGINIIDGKFEIGRGPDGEYVTGDECGTPDSCRFVDTNDVVPHQEPTWLDKEFLRKEAERIWNGGKKVPLTFSKEAIAETVRRYQLIYERLTGKTIV